MKSKYVNIPSLVQVIGCVYNNPTLLEDTRYSFMKEDFYDSFHQLIFSTIYNLYQLGTKEINLITIEDYLASRPKAAAEYKQNKGAEFILKCAEAANETNFYYYYNRMRKMTFLRECENVGLPVTEIYDPDELDTKKLQQQEDFIDNTSIATLMDIINDKVDAIRMTFVDGSDQDTTNLGNGVFDFLAELEERPDLGYPLYGHYINTVTRGARFKKFFLRSAATNVGKTRTMVADVCFIGCTQLYDDEQQKWISIGAGQPTMFITTEQDINEVQSMALAFLSGVNEEHISLNEYFAGEKERVMKAAQILRESKIEFICLPDFSLQDIENIIKKSVRLKGAKYIFFDYMHTSLGILTEISQRSGGVKLREDNVLYMMAVKLKDIANQYGVFILSSTQLNGDWKTSDTPDQNLLRGAKAIADKIDWGGIMLEVTKEDIEKIQPILNKNGLPVPNVKMSIYKNRANKYKGVYMWMVADKGTCRFNTIFLTDWNYRLLEEVPDVKIKVQEESVF